MSLVPVTSPVSAVDMTAPFLVSSARACPALTRIRYPRSPAQTRAKRRNRSSAGRAPAESRDEAEAKGASSRVSEPDRRAAPHHDPGRAAQAAPRTRHVGIGEGPAHVSTHQRPGRPFLPRMNQGPDPPPSRLGMPPRCGTLEVLDHSRELTRAVGGDGSCLRDRLKTEKHGGPDLSREIGERYEEPRWRPSPIRRRGGAAHGSGQQPEGQRMDFTTCPECGVQAEIEWRAVLESTDGPVEHAKVRCSNRHWFLLPVASLERPRRSAVAATMGRSAGHRRPP